MPILESPPLGAMLLARELPASGGATQFADLAGALSKLSRVMQRRVRRMRAIHDLETIRKRMGLTDPAEIRSEYPPSEHPLVCRDPLSGREALLFGAHTTRVRDLPDEESEALLGELLRHATRDEFVYSHEWRRLDLLFWNNRRVLHRVLDYDDATDRRRLWRVEVLGSDRPGGKPLSLWRRLLAAH